MRNGLRSVTTETVVVHDAVRPAITPALIGRVLSALRDADAVIAAVPVDETIKRVMGSEVTSTVDRSDLWRAQTPQAFRTDVLKSAHEHAERDRLEFTDDAQIVEHYGGRVLICPGERTNLKVTWPADFEIAESLLRARSGSRSWQ